MYQHICIYIDQEDAVAAPPPSKDGKFEAIRGAGEWGNELYYITVY